MNKVFELIKNLDLYSHKISFNYRDKNVFHSIYGMFLSCIIYVIVISFTYYCSIDYIFSINPKTNFKEVEFTKLLSFAYSDFIKTLSLKAIVSVDTKFMENYLKTNNKTKQEIMGARSEIYTYYNENFDSEIYNLNFNTSTMNVTVTQDQSNKNNSLYTLVQNINLNSSFVAKRYFEFNETLGTYGNSEVLSFKNLTDFNFGICNSSFIYFKFFIAKDIIEKINLQSFFYELYYYDNIIDANSAEFYKNYSYINTNSYEKLNLDSYITMNKLNYRISQVRDDKGPIISKFSEQSKFQKNYEFTQISRFDKSQQGFYFNMIVFDKVLKQYDRIYKKIQNIFADIGGITNTLILFGNIIVMQLNRKKFHYDIVSLIFEYDEVMIKDGSGKKILIKKMNTIFKNEKKIGKVFELPGINKNNKNNIEENDNINDLVNSPKINFNKTEEFFNHSANNFSMNDITNKINNKTKFKPETNSLRIDGSVNCNSSIISDRNVKRNIMFEENKNNFRKSYPIENLKIDNKKEILKNNPKMHRTMSLMVKSSDNLKFNNKKEIEKPNEVDEIRDKVKSFVNTEKIKTKKFIDLTNGDILKMMICCRCVKTQKLLEKEIVFKEFENKIQKYLDILNYTQFIEDFEKIKHVLFNKNQITSLEFSRERNYHEILNIRDEDIVLKSINYFKEKIKNQNLDPLDRKLMGYFSKDYLNLIKG